MDAGRLLVIVLFLIALAPVAAAREEVNTSWYQWDASTTLNEKTVSFQLNGANSALLIQYGDDSTIASQEDCEVIEAYEFCFKDKSEDEKPAIDDDGELRPGIEVGIYEIDDSTTTTDGGSPSFSASFNTTGETLSETLTGTVLLDNTGDGAMFNFSADLLTSGLEPTLASEDVIRVGDAYRVTGGVESDENKTVTFDYTVNTLEPRIFVEYEYDTINGDHVDATTNISVPTIDPYEVSFDAPETTGLYTVKPVTLNVTSNVKSGMEATLGVSQDRNQGLRGDSFRGDPPRTNVTIPYNETESEEVTYTPRYTGDTNLNASYQLRFAGMNDSVTKNKTITTPQPDVTTKMGVQSTIPGQATNAVFNVSNNADYTVHDVEHTVSGPFGVEQQSMRNITRNQAARTTIPYAVPHGVRPKTYKVDLITRYETPSNEQFKTTKTADLTLQRANYSLAINTSFNNTDPDLNDSVRVTVTAENLGRQPLDDITFESKSGTSTTSATVVLLPGSQKELYNYTMIYDGNTSVITTVKDDRVKHTTYAELSGEQPQKTGGKEATRPEENTTEQAAQQNTSLANQSEDTAPPGPSVPSNASDTKQTESNQSTVERIGSFLEGVVQTVENHLPWS